MVEGTCAELEIIWRDKSETGRTIVPFRSCVREIEVIIPRFELLICSGAGRNKLSHEMEVAGRWMELQFRSWV